MLHPSLHGLKTILAIGSHADDIEIGCGGTLLRLLSEHPLHLHWVVLSGADGRGEEARASAELYRREAKSFTLEIEQFPDTRFPASYEEIKDYFARLGKSVSPDLIFTHRREDLHQDHRLVAELTWNTFRDHLVLEYEIPKYEGDLGQPNLFVDLDETTCKRKIENLVEKFPSQHSHPWFEAETFWALLRLRGVEAGRGGGFAEAFHGRKLVL